MWKDFKKEKPSDDKDFYVVFCKYGACQEQCIAYLGDNGFFYSEETHALLPVTHWKNASASP